MSNMQAEYRLLQRKPERLRACLYRGGLIIALELVSQYNFAAQLLRCRKQALAKLAVQ